MEKKSQEGLTVKKEENFSEWFQQLALKSELADYSEVSGCIVFRALILISNFFESFLFTIVT